MVLWFQLVLTARYFLKSHEANLKKIQDTVFATLPRSPWIVIRATREKWLKTDTMKEQSIGELSIKSETEYEEVTPLDCYLDETLQIRYEGRKEIACNHPTKPNEAISHVIEMPVGPVDDFLNAYQKLKRKVVYYFLNFSYLTGKLNARNFKWRNEQMMADVPKNKRSPVSFTARSLLLRCLDKEHKNKWYPLNICFWYCFANESPFPTQNTMDFKFIFGNSVDVDLTLDTGALRFDKEENKYYLLNTKFKTSGEKDTDVGGLLHGFLKG